MAANNTFRISQYSFLNKKILQHSSTKCIGYLSYNQPFLTKSTALVRHEECNQTRQKKIIGLQVTRLNSQNIPHKNRQILPSIISYFSGAQREIRERRADGISLLHSNEKNYMHKVYCLRNPGGGYGKSSQIPAMFYTVQTANFVGLITVALATFRGVMGNFSLQIPWSKFGAGEFMVLDQIGLGLIAVTTSIMVLGPAFALWRFPVRIYYDEINGIYTAAFCRICLPFQTITYSFPAESAEELPPNKLLMSYGLYTGDTIKIRPIQRDVYIHHLENLSAETNTNTDKHIPDKEYFPPAVASATLAVKESGTFHHQREIHESLKMNRTPRKVGYMPPAYASAVAAIAADKAAVSKRFVSWAAAEKACHIPIKHFMSPVFYYKMFKKEEDLE